jgi:hypothetical protein
MSSKKQVHTLEFSNRKQEIIIGGKITTNQFVLIFGFRLVYLSAFDGRSSFKANQLVKESSFL